MIKHLLKTKSPKMYFFLKKIQEKCVNSNKIESGPKDSQLDILNTNAVLMDKVLNGPFKGMHYIDTSSGSAWLPKVIGSYEEPIHAWIYSIIKNNEYDTILDIGCAEGYYAIGFSLKTKAKIHAFDLNRDALNKAKSLAKLNDKLGQIIFYDECTSSMIDQLSIGNTLIFCDIEGYENILLDPKKSKKLLNVDIIVETHDCFFEGTEVRLSKRFKNSHNIEKIEYYMDRKGEYEIPEEVQSLINLSTLYDERRPSQGISFLFMKKKNEIV